MPGSDETPPRKPLITANQITFARLALLPIGSYLLYRGHGGQWAALVSMTIVGCTDFVDGWLARRHGPTVLGGLMDPIADKVFVAMTMLPALDLGWIPVDVVALIFLREFVITAARTAYSRRDVSLRTSYLAKIKTWYQMIVSGLIFLLGISPPTMRKLIVAGLVIAVAGGVVFFAIKRRVWRGSVAFALSFGAVLLFVPFDDEVLRLRAPLIALGLGWSTAAITWASGGAYLFGLRELVTTRRIDAEEVVRMIGAVTLPVLACLLLATHVVAPGSGQLDWFKKSFTWTGPAWPVFSTVAVEFAIGGLDNLLAHQKRLGSWRLWGARVVTQAGLLGAALYAAHAGAPSVVINSLNLSAFAITAVAAAIYFYVHREAYLGARSRERRVA